MPLSLQPSYRAIPYLLLLQSKINKYSFDCDDCDDCDDCCDGDD